jgi:hypothetical protein
MTAWSDCWLSFATGFASCAVVVLALHHRAPQPERWTQLETVWSRYHEFRSLKLGPVYPWRHQCERALPSSGMETLGGRTTFREFECVRLN